MGSYPEQSPAPSSVQPVGGITTENDRKRRDNINDKIQQLLKMIPPDFFEDYYKRKDSTEEGSVNAAALGLNSKAKGTGTKDGKPNKGQILTQAVEYIAHMQGQVDAKNREEVELIIKIKELSKQMGVFVNDINIQNTSAEVALARIGVGPLADAPGEFDRDQNNNNFDYGGYDEYGSGA
ncbi:LAMI_0H19548g1_1 [Lachancea mirantina]|uniref:LAMI_0H19548g1_1 n=1 Tax=Lachancea mirantina TaxID=1230905 RepID=A0A1G4KJX6_9SACH|nr:LAMI_0H19548g1_1 [Lachancea mirantina]